MFESSAQETIEHASTTMVLDAFLYLDFRSQNAYVEHSIRIYCPPGPSFTGLSLGEYLSIPRHGAFRPDLSATNQHLRSPSFAQASFLISSPHDDGFDLIRCRFVLKARGAGRTSSKRKNKGNVPLAYYKVLRATSMHWSVEKYTQIFNIPLSLWLESSLKNF